MYFLRRRGIYFSCQFCSSLKLIVLSAILFNNKYSCTCYIYSAPEAALDFPITFHVVDVRHSNSKISPVAAVAVNVTDISGVLINAPVEFISTPVIVPAARDIVIMLPLVAVITNLYFNPATDAGNVIV